MKQYLYTIALMLVFSNPATADFLIGSYLIQGVIKDQRNQAIKNAEMIIQQGDYLKLIKTNSDGAFVAELLYLIPCTSGRSGKNDPRVIRDAESYNGKELLFWIEKLGESASIKSQWEQYYFGTKSRNDTLKVDLKTTDTIQNNFNKINERRSKYIYDKSIIEKFKSSQDNITDKYRWSVENVLEYIELRGLALEETILKTGLQPQKIGENSASITNRWWDNSEKVYVLILDNFGIIRDVKVEWNE